MLGRPPFALHPPPQCRGRVRRAIPLSGVQARAACGSVGFRDGIALRLGTDEQQAIVLAMWHALRCQFLALARSLNQPRARVSGQLPPTPETFLCLWGSTQRLKGHTLVFPKQVIARLDL